MLQVILKYDTNKKTPGSALSVDHISILDHPMFLLQQYRSNAVMPGVLTVQTLLFLR